MLKVYLDNCCYSRPFDDLRQAKVNDEATAKLYVQSLIKFNVLKLYYSFISLAEIFDCPYEDKQNAILRFISEVNAVYIGSDKTGDIIPFVKEIMATGIKEKDARHVACAIYAECDYLLTTDKRLLNYKTDKIKLVNPIDFVKIWEGNNG
jgi:predicted nucleic acid-binding protein